MIGRSDCWPTSSFPPWSDWEKGHDRIERRRIARVGTTPERIGLCGCWQVLKIERESIELSSEDKTPKLHTNFYATSLTEQEHTEAVIMEIVRGHWAAIENGTHNRRDKTFDEDSCRVNHRSAAPNLACLRNLANGAYELARARGRSDATSLNNWCEGQTFSMAYRILLS